MYRKSLEEEEDEDSELMCSIDQHIVSYQYFFLADVAIVCEIF